MTTPEQLRASAVHSAQPAQSPSSPRSQTPGTKEGSGMASAAGDPARIPADAERLLREFVALLDGDGVTEEWPELRALVNKAAALRSQTAGLPPSVPQDTMLLDVAENCFAIQRDYITGTRSIRGYAESIEVEHWCVVYDGVTYWGETLRGALEAVCAATAPAEPSEASEAKASPAVLPPSHAREAGGGTSRNGYDLSTAEHDITGRRRQSGEGR